MSTRILSPEVLSYMNEVFNSPEYFIYQPAQSFSQAEIEDLNSYWDERYKECLEEHLGRYGF